MLAASHDAAEPRRREGGLRPPRYRRGPLDNPEQVSVVVGAENRRGAGTAGPRQHDRAGVLPARRNRAAGLAPAVPYVIRMIWPACVMRLAEEPLGYRCPRCPPSTIWTLCA